MRDSLNLSPTPVGEDCAQLGDANYSSRARQECRAFIQQLKREFGEPPIGAAFKITQNPHDFGTYLDVDIQFNDEDDAASEYAYKVEANLPEFWDAAAKKELFAGEEDEE
jgi:hypothetical protein